MDTEEVSELQQQIAQTELEYKCSFLTNTPILDVVDYLYWQ